MDFLKQTKLTQEEWCHIERPIQDKREQAVLDTIKNGYDNLNITWNHKQCLGDYLKISSNYDGIIFNNFILEYLQKFKNLSFTPEVTYKHPKHMKTSDKIKMSNSKEILVNDERHKDKIVEFKILSELQKYHRYLDKKTSHKSHKPSKSSISNIKKKMILSYINIHFLWKEFAQNLNGVLVSIIEKFLDMESNIIDTRAIVNNISKYYEHNEIFNYRKICLYDHQKDIFQLFKNKNKTPKFVFYCAPTSSGKTLTPIALAEEYKIIFVCASKHIGLSLAKSSYHVGRKIGFAFGCETVDNICLNYNAISKYKTTNYGKKIPDHSDGSNVEMMICDILSFESAMTYMCNFHEPSNTILFWDEPTIGLDVATHELHSVISRNWSENIIPNIVFSCATLPDHNLIKPVINGLKMKFNNLSFHLIESIDYFSNITLYDNQGQVIIPHTFFKDYGVMINFLNYHGKKYYKFYDCNECAKFLLFLENNYGFSYIKDNLISLDDISMFKIKDIYVSALKTIGEEKWKNIHKEFIQTCVSNDVSECVGINLTSEHARTLTNGPTLFVSDNVENISKYMLMKASLEKNTLNNIEKKIEKNHEILQSLVQMRKDYEDKIEIYKDRENIMTNMRLPPEVLELHNNIEKMQNKLFTLSLDNIHKPNTRSHYNKWKHIDAPAYEESDVFSSSLGDEDIKSIIELQNIKTLYKMIMMMGIGVFSNSIMKETENNNVQKDNNKYIETMKKLAEEKGLYLIIANSDYIYGTNYQFSHCYLSKDMKNLTQEKIIQCIGRVGRQEKNKHFSFRFRTEEHVNTFYSVVHSSVEAENMNRLFV